MSNFIKNIQVGAELFWTDRQTVVQYRQTDRRTERQKLIVALRDISKTSMVCQNYRRCTVVLQVEWSVLQ